MLQWLPKGFILIVISFLCILILILILMMKCLVTRNKRKDRKKEICSMYELRRTQRFEYFKYILS